MITLAGKGAGVLVRRDVRPAAQAEETEGARGDRCLEGSTRSLIASRWQQCLLALDEMSAVPGPLRRRTLEVAVSARTGFPDGAADLNLDVGWIHGSEAAKYNTDPDIQVHACDEHTYILRQNMAVHYEAPFMFLLFGGSRALLLDTGATANPQFFPLRRTVDWIIDGLAGRAPAPRRLQAARSPYTLPH